jgi:hypothetical protein
MKRGGDCEPCKRPSRLCACCCKKRNVSANETTCQKISTSCLLLHWSTIRTCRARTLARQCELHKTIDKNIVNRNSKKKKKKNRKIRFVRTALRCSASGNIVAATSDAFDSASSASCRLVVVVVVVVVDAVAVVAVVVDVDGVGGLALTTTHRINHKSEQGDS